MLRTVGRRELHDVSTTPPVQRGCCSLDRAAHAAGE
jgi:hypothetical protein